MKGRVWLAKALIASLVLAITAVGVSAQSYRRYSEREIYELAQRNGYRMGVREGRYDRREGNRSDYKRHRAYKDGKYGYRDEYRHDGNYKDGFRNGFEAGYRAGYNGNDRNDRNDRWDDRRDDRYDDRYDRRNRTYDDRDDDYYRRDDRNNRRRPYYN